MDGGIKDNGSTPPVVAPTEPTIQNEQLSPIDKLRADFSALPQAQQVDFAREAIIKALQLHKGTVDYLDATLIDPARQAFGDNNTATPESTATLADEQTSITEPQQAKLPEAESSMEDEFIAAVKNISFFGKFPNGLSLKGNQFLTAGPGSVRTDFAPHSPDNWRFNPSRSIPLHYWFGAGGDGYSGKNVFPNTAFITEQPVEDDPSSTAITFHFSVDGSQKDGFKRKVGFTLISLKLPRAQATALLKTIKSRPDGADISERFLQKTIPGVLDGDLNSPGIKREKTDSLVVLDEQTLNGFFRSPQEIDSGEYHRSSSTRQFQDYVKQNVEFKRFSAPVGVIPEQTTS